MLAAAVATAALLASLPAAARTARFSACLVTGADASADHLAYLGLLQAERHGIAGQVVRSTSPADDVASLRSCARRHAGLTIAVGLPMADATDAAATAFPDEEFAIVDVDIATLTHRPSNVVGLLFREQQAGYLVGYAAGLWAKAHHGKAVGSIGGMQIPPVDGYIAGYQFGAKRADPSVTVLNDYAEDFVTEKACRQKALAQIARGSVVEFQVAGRCGLGVLAAAREKNVFAIGVDSDQGRLGPWVMTSALKRVDVAVADAILRARAGTLDGGTNVEYGVGADGVGYGAWSPRVPPSIRAAVARQYRLLRAGRITGIPTTLK